MTDSLAFMVSTIQGLSTNLLTAKVLISAFSNIGLFAAITSNFFDNFTARTRARMANFFAVMFATVFGLVTNFIARKSGILISTSCSHLLASTIAALLFSDCSARRARTRMAAQRTGMNAVGVTEFAACTSTRVRNIIRIKFRVSFLATETFIIWHRFSIIVVTFRTSPVEELETRNHFAVLEVGRILEDPFLKTR